MKTGNNPFGTPGNAKGSDSDDDFSLELDLTEVAEGFRIEAGDYPAKLLTVEQEVSKSSGNKMLKWTFAIIGDKYSGKEFRNYTVLTPAALFKVAETLKALGYKGAGSVVNFKKSDVEGKRVILRIKDDTYNDEPSSSIGKVLPHPDGPEMPKASTGPAVSGKKPKKE